MSVARLLAAFALAGSSVALFAACADEQIVLATLPPGEDGGLPSQPRRCVDARECSSKEFCSRVTCGDVAGFCELAPVLCEEDARPACGCDGVTYWNDCLRRTAGITAAMPGECGYNARMCRHGGGKGGPPGEPDDCPPGAYCAHLLSLPGVQPPPEFCAPDAPGTCWALPAACPDHAGPDRWIACGTPQTVCAPTCDAIRSGLPYKRASACP